MDVSDTKAIIEQYYSSKTLDKETIAQDAVHGSEHDL